MAHFFTPLSNQFCVSISFLFRQRKRVRKGCMIAYIYNVRAAERRKREVRVHSLYHPCAHARLSLCIHSTIGCSDRQQRMCTQVAKMYSQINGMHIYTNALYIYAILTARESRICTKLFFRAKTNKIFNQS